MEVGLHTSGLLTDLLLSSISPLFQLGPLGFDFMFILLRGLEN
jgi:hypothetical protein